MSREIQIGIPPIHKIPLEVFAGSEAWADLPEAIKVAVVHVWRAERDANLRVDAAVSRG